MTKRSQTVRPFAYNVIISSDLISDMQEVFDWLYETGLTKKPITFIGQQMTRLIRPDCCISMSYPCPCNTRVYRAIFSFRYSDNAILCKLKFGAMFMPNPRLHADSISNY